MIDLRLLREQPDLVRAVAARPRRRPELVDALLDADAQRRAAIDRASALRAEQKVARQGRRGRQGDERAALLEKAEELAAAVKEAEAAEAAAEAALRAVHLAVPNVVEHGAPPGGEDDYVVLREVGDVPEIAAPRDHLELGDAARRHRRRARRARSSGLALLLPDRHRRAARARAGQPARWPARSPPASSR